MTALNFPANPSNGDVYENYQYDGTDGVWKRLPSSSLGINGLADVTITTPADGESLVYDNATGEWINADATVEVYGVDTAETSYFSLPKGTDAQRPVSPSNGDIRFNTDSGSPEWYSDSFGSWLNFSQSPLISVEYLVVAGGGGGSGNTVNGNGRGGGGAGGYRSSVFGELSGQNQTAEDTLELPSGTYTIEVGAGGNGGANATSGSNGSDSVFGTVSSTGGGGGAFGGSAASGGSGGGAPTAGTPGSGTLGQGFDGGTSLSDPTYRGGGGGGASEAGGTNGQGQGGDGITSSITGSSVTRGGGGGAAQYVSAGSGTVAGGAGGGGNGGVGTTSGTSGINNTGGGGGGAGATNTFVASSGNGGSGIVVFKIPSWVTPTFSVGLTEANSGNGQTIGDYKVYTVTAGTGTVTF